MTTSPSHEHMNDLTTHILSVLEGILDSSGEDAAFEDDASQSVFTVPDTHSNQVKSLLLTLHFMYPHELLPALDLLDRKLISCHNYLCSIEPQSKPSKMPNCERRVLDSVSQKTIKVETFYIQSVSASVEDATTPFHHRQEHGPTGSYYEVRLDSWNCTCSAFAQSSITSGIDSPDHLQQVIDESLVDGEVVEACSATRFGGDSTLSANVPFCKHMLAVAMWKAVPPGFRNLVDVQYTSTTTTAGWAAGWGDHD